MNSLSNIAYIIALVVSILWFSAAFRYFGFQHFAAAKVLIPHSQRASPIFPTTAASIRFLGGMNGAFASLSLLLIIAFVSGSSLFEDPLERACLMLILAMAHFSQFAFNVPILMNGERQGDSYWYVRSGPMLFIFVVDIVATLICLVSACAQSLM
jgi:hypothetical protein